MANIDTRQYKFDVFISYRHKEPDMSWVRETLVPRLKDEGLRVFIDIEQFDIGDKIVTEMENAVQQSRFTLAIMSPNYLAGDFARFENLLAKLRESTGEKSRLLIVKREPCELPLYLRSSLFSEMIDDTAFADNSRELCIKLRPRKLFLVYAESDEDEKWVNGFLKPGLGIDAYIIDRKNNFKLGSNTDLQTDSAITNSDHTVLVLSPAFFDDQWASEVLNRTVHLGLENSSKQAISLKRTGCELPDSISAREFLDFSEPSFENTNLSLLRKHLGLPEPETKQLKIKCPYPGMEPFKEGDAQFFYGRDKEIKKAQDTLSNQNFLFVIGPSGSGKSSLVFAGIVPALKKKQPEYVLVKSLRPGKTPVEELKKVLAITTDKNEKDIIDAKCIAELLATSPPTQQFLLIIDQLEEIFVLATVEQQSNFFSSVQSLFSIPACKIIFTIRADFYADLMKCKLWSVVSHAKLEVTALSGKGLAQALEEPANKQEVYLEDRLVERLIADAANESGVLPLIQVTMGKLWEQLEQHWITLDDYKQLGRHGRSGLAVALANKADGTLNSLNNYKDNQPHKIIARRIFLRLIHFGVGRSDTRRQQSIKQLNSQEEDPQIFKDTLQHLVANRLLTLSSNFESGNNKNQDIEKKVDISHEALISGWPTLQKWIAKRRRSEITRRLLENKAQNWIKGGASKKTGLLDEEELAQAKKWLKRKSAKNLGYSSELVALCKASQHKIYRFKILTRVVLSAIMILFIATIWQLGQSEYHRKNARSGELAATARLIRDKSPKQLPLSLLISIESITGLRASTLESLFFGKSSTLAGTRILREDLAILGKAKMSQPSANKRIKAIAFSPDGKLFASASENQLCIWETISMQNMTCLEHDTAVTNLVFAENSTQIYSTSKGGHLHRWNTKTRKQLWTFTTNKAIKSIVLNNKGNYLAGIVGQSVQLWHTKDGNKGSVFNHGQAIKAISFAANSVFLNSVSRNKVIVWNIDKKMPHKTLAFNVNITKQTYSPDGHLLAAANSQTKIVSVWDLLTMKKTLDTKHNDTVYAIAFDQRSEFLATGVKDGTAHIWNLANGTSTTLRKNSIIKTIIGNDKLQSPGAVMDINFSLDSRYVATANTDLTASIWNRDTGKEFLRMIHDEKVRQVGFSPSGKILASATKNTGVWLWGLNKGDELARLNHETIVTQLSYSQDGRYLCTVDTDSYFYLWDIITGTKISKDDNHCPAIGLSAQPSAYKTIIDTDNHKVLIMQGDHKIAEVHHIDIELATISADGKFLATSDYNWIHIWEWQSSGLLFWNQGQFTKLSDIRNIQRGINDITFSPDNRYLATAGSDNTAIVRYWQQADLVDRSCSRLSKKNLTMPEWKDYIYDEDYRKTCP